jgi:hypothetical protein
MMHGSTNIKSIKGNYISTQSNIAIFLGGLVATSFGHYGHHQSNVIQKFKEAGYIRCLKIICYGIPFTLMSIFINSIKIINGLKNVFLCFL